MDIRNRYPTFSIKKKYVLAVMWHVLFFNFIYLLLMCIIGVSLVYSVLEIVIQSHPKVCLFLSQFLTPFSVFSYLAPIHDTYSNSEGMKAVTNVIWRAGGGIVLFPWLWVLVGVVSKRVRGKMTKSISKL